MIRRYLTAHKPTGNGMARVHLDWLQRSLSACVDLAYPKVCTLCQRPLRAKPLATPLCDPCVSAIRSDRDRCQKCSSPMHPSVVAEYGCIHCRQYRWSFRRAYALGAYSGALARAVVLMKRPYFEALSLAVGDCFAEWLSGQALPRYDAIVPTPQHWWRRMMRRTNSADLIAECISRRIHVPVRRHWLYRTRATRKQGMLVTSERQENVRGAFALRNPARVREKSLLLVDDILTTGSTAHEMARTLRRAGCAPVDVAIIARGIGA